MKTTLQFNDEEMHEAKMAILSKEIYCSLFRASENLVKLVNHHPDLAFTDDQDEAIRAVIREMSETLDILS